MAEGVETPEHIEYVKQQSLGIASGFYFAKPLNVEDFEQYIDNKSWSIPLSIVANKEDEEMFKKQEETNEE